jgi:hypothetical protein
MASKSEKFDRELFRLLIQEFKKMYKIDGSSLNDLEKIRQIINVETKEEYEARLNQQEEDRIRVNKKEKPEGRKKVKGKLSDETIKRAFELKKSYEGSHDSTTCNNIACKVGYDGWNDFCKKAIENYSTGFQTIDFYSFSSLLPERPITIGWYPRKYCVLKYLGEYEFEVLENCGLKSEIGRKFKTSGFQLASSGSKMNLPGIIIKPLFDNDPLWILIDDKDPLRELFMDNEIPEESELWL